MCHLLHRYLLKEIVFSTVLATGFFVFVLLIGNAMRDVLSLVVAGKLEILLFLKLMGLLIPYVASYALPMGMLTGTLVAFGRLSAQHEITAMKASGFGLFRIAAPVFFVATLVMLAGLAVNLHYAPESRVAYKKLMISAISENPIGFIEARRFINEFPGVVIYTDAREKNVLKDVWFWKLDDKKRVDLFIRGREGTVDFRDLDNTLLLTVTDCLVEKRHAEAPEKLSEDVMLLSFGELSFEWSLDEVFGPQKTVKTKVKHMALAELMEARERVLLAEQESNASMSKERMSLQFHIQKNSALAFSVFSLAVFGVPLAIRVGRSESYANFGIALIIAMGYYFLMIAVSWMEGMVALRPDLWIWLPNILFQSVGFRMLMRADRC